MNNRIRFQKDVFFRALQLHCLRSRTVNMDLIRLVIDDPLVFELTYEKVLQRWAAEHSGEPAGTGGAPSDTYQLLIPRSFHWLQWLTEQRDVLLDEIRAVVDCFGGIEVASFLMDEESAQVVGRCQA